MSEIRTNDRGQVVLTPQMILDDLNNGYTREEIATRYNLTAGDLKQMFQHPELKGRKTKSIPGFVWGNPNAIPENNAQEIPQADRPHDAPYEQDSIN